jgi:hypothetical protein
MVGLLLALGVGLQSLASAALFLPIPHVAHELVAAENPKPDQEHAPEGAAGGASERKKEAVLTVVVTGNHKPVEGAEVIVALPPGGGDEAQLRTDTHGEATCKSSVPGAAKVRVILAGWVGVLKDVTLKPGLQRVTIELEPL